MSRGLWPAYWLGYGMGDNKQLSPEHYETERQSIRAGSNYSFGSPRIGVGWCGRGGVVGEVVMAKKQHAWAVLTQQAKSLLEQSMVQPSGETVSVTDNDGNETQVPELHGGFALIGKLGDWRMAIGCGMDFVFESMIQQLQAVGAQAGSPVGVLLAIVDDIDSTEQPDYDQLDAPMPAEAKAAVDAWLVAHGHEAAPSGSYRDIIEHVGEVFRSGFQIGEDFIA